MVWTGATTPAKRVYAPGEHSSCCTRHKGAATFLCGACLLPVRTHVVAATLSKTASQHAASNTSRNVGPCVGLDVFEEAVRQGRSFVSMAFGKAHSQSPSPKRSRGQTHAVTARLPLRTIISCTRFYWSGFASSCRCRGYRGMHALAARPACLGAGWSCRRARLRRHGVRVLVCSSAPSGKEGGDNAAGASSGGVDLLGPIGLSLGPIGMSLGASQQRDGTSSPSQTEASDGPAPTTVRLNTLNTDEWKRTHVRPGASEPQGAQLARNLHSNARDACCLFT